MAQKCWTIGLLILLMTALACQEELADRYLSPDKTASPSLDKFFTAMLDNNRVRPSYWEISTFVNWHIGIYSQSVGFLNSESMYQQNESYIQDRWNDFYRPSANGAGVVAHFRELERSYDALPASLQATNEIFLRAAQVVLYDQATQMVDLWGDIPFSEAGMLNQTGDLIYPRFDKGADIYDEAISKLRDISHYFTTVDLSNSIRTIFSKQDLLLNGNIDQWIRYTNSVRLRLLMRISFADEPRARDEVMAMLNNPTKYPLLNDIDYYPSKDDVLLTPLANYTDDLHAAFTDWTNYPAPYYMLEKVLKPANDLRLPVLFDKFGMIKNNQFIPNENYEAMPLELSRVEQQATLGNYAIIDSATFLFNAKLPGIVITVAEVNFLKAEAFERWGGGDPGVEYQKGIKHSTQFYYYLNGLGRGVVHPPPSNEDIEKFVDETLAIRYEGNSIEKLSKIWTQKWVHFGFLQTGQRWAELRRTSYPLLEFAAATLPGYELPPSRLTYPPSERTFNRHYQDVSADDHRSSKIFWDVR